MIKFYFVILIPVLIFTDLSKVAYAQFEDIKFIYGDYTFTAKYDTAMFTTRLRIKKEDKSIFSKIFYERIGSIKDFDLDNDGKKEILIEMYSGGAHCCTSLYAGEITNSRFVFTDSVMWGNSFYEIEDINNDGKYEISGVNDMFAYAFTNYAESKFSLLIYGFENNKFVNVTKDFPSRLTDNINWLREDLKSYTDTGFKCEEINDDTFNTESGAVKAILAAIVADYSSMNEVYKGYELVDSVYNCPDKESFKLTLKNDFHLK